MKKKKKKKKEKKIFKKIQETKIHAIRCFPAGSFAVHIGDHLRFGIICGAVQTFNVHDSRQVGFQIVMQIIHVLCWIVTLEESQIAENRLDEILK